MSRTYTAVVEGNFIENEEYTKFIDKWTKIRKIEESCVKEYCIPPEFQNNYSNSRIKARNNKYVEMAIFYNYLINTVYGLLGRALRIEPTVEMPTGLEYMRTHATGNNLSIQQLIRWTLGEVIKMGRVGLRVDYPLVNPKMSTEQKTKSGVRPLIYTHTPESIPDWGIDSSKGLNIMNMVLIKEHIVQRRRLDKDVYDQYRLLYLDDNNMYVWEILDQEGKQAIGAQTPVSAGKAMTEIPFIFIGSEDNDPSVDNPPMWPIAEINLGHYRNSASYEANVDKHGTGTLFITTEMNSSEWEKMYGNRPIVLGSGEGYYLGRNGRADLLQLGPHQEALAAMVAKENAIIGIGGDILRPDVSNISEETTIINKASQFSKLGTMMRNVGDGVEAMLKQCAIMEGLNPEECKVTMNYDYIPRTSNPEELKAIAATWQMGALPQSVLFDYARKTGLVDIEKTDEDLKKELSEESPLGNDLGFNSDSQFQNQEQAFNNNEQPINLNKSDNIPQKV